MLIFAMAFKRFLEINREDRLHIVEPGATKGFFKHILTYTAMILFVAAFIVFQVAAIPFKLVYNALKENADEEQE